MEKTESTPIPHPIRHLSSQDGKSWVGLVDGVYAIAMTLIAINLPELLTSLLALPRNDIVNQLITRLVIYEFIAYIATFLVLYDLWSIHRVILKMGGLKCQAQNILNGLALSLSCLGAGNIIVSLKEKSASATEAIRKNISVDALFSTWVNSHASLSFVTFIIAAAMFFTMSFMARSSTNESSPSELRILSKDLWRKGCFFFLSLIIWVPMLFGQKILMPPAPLVITYLVLSYNQHHIANFFQRNRTHA